MTMFTLPALILLAGLTLNGLQDDKASEPAVQQNAPVPAPPADQNQPAAEPAPTTAVNPPETPQNSTVAPPTSAPPSDGAQKGADSLQLKLPTHTNVPPPPPDPNEFKVKTEVQLVLLDVAVKDSNGGFVTGLKKENFHVFDNKVEQPIRTFASQDAPVTVGLVVDNSGSVRPKKPEIVTAALTFVTQSNPKDEVFVVNFNDRVRMGLPQSVPFTDDRNLLRQALLNNPAQGRTALYDGLKTALEHLEQGHLEKKTLVLISDGGDNASDISRDRLMHMAEESLATVYTVGIFNSEDKDKNPGMLKALARLTGGEYYEPQNISHLVGVCEKIAHDIRNRYTIGFAPGASTGDSKPHQLRVTVSDGTNHKLEARTRTHYIPVENRTRSASR